MLNLGGGHNQGNGGEDEEESECAITRVAAGLERTVLLSQVKQVKCVL